LSNKGQKPPKKYISGFKKGDDLLMIACMYKRSAVYTDAGINPAISGTTYKLF